MWPCRVNFNALFRKLEITWLRRIRSILIAYSSACSGMNLISIPVLAFSWKTDSISWKNWFSSTVFSVKSITPASILEMSKMSLISCSKMSLLTEIIRVYSALSSSLKSISLASRFEKPTMALSGVLISWLILAIKADFNRSDSSALAFAWIKFASIFFRLSISALRKTSSTCSPEAWGSRREAWYLYQCHSLFWRMRTCLPKVWACPWAASSINCNNAVRSSGCIYR